MDVDALLGNAESLVTKALRKGADEAEAYLEEGASLDIDIEADALAGAGSDRHAGGSVRLVKDGRVGFAYFSDLSHAARAIDDALALSRLAPKKDFRLPAPHGAAAKLATTWDDGIAALDPAVIIDAAQEMLQAGKAALPEASISGGGVSIAMGGAAIASSAGVGCAERSTQFQAGLAMTLADGETAVQAWDQASTHTGRLDGTALAESLGETVRSLRHPAEAVAGTQDVVLLPNAAADLVVGLVAGAVDGDDAMRGKSFWSSKQGETVAHEGLTITDDPHHPLALGGAAYDGEGLATRRTPLIEAGRLHGFVFGAWDAHIHDMAGTAHGARGGSKDVPGTGLHHVVVEHDQTVSLDELIRDVKQGILVESVLGAHTANGTTGDLSVTAPNVWRIEAGAVVGASKEVAIGGNLPKMLADLDAVSDAPKAMHGRRVPAMRFRNVVVSA